MKDGLIDTIKSRGYWRINFQPLVDRTQLSSLGECLEIVQRSAVKFRGWDYPHIPVRNDVYGGLVLADNHYIGWTDWFQFKEFWHMYLSGQFLHYLALREDWDRENFAKRGWTEIETIAPGKLLDYVGGLTYQLTEVFQFLGRLAAANIYNEGVRVSISLHNTKDRRLWTEIVFRIPLMGEYITPLPDIRFEGHYSREQVVATPKELAEQAIVHFIDRFRWHKPNLEMIRQDQENLLSGRA